MTHEQDPNRAFKIKLHEDAWAAIKLLQKDTSRDWRDLIGWVFACMDLHLLK